jgi:hypothetical protein
MASPYRKFNTIIASIGAIYRKFNTISASPGAIYRKFNKILTEEGIVEESDTLSLTDSIITNVSLLKEEVEESINISEGSLIKTVTHRNIFSDAEITSKINKRILSDAHIKSLNNQSNVLSDAYITSRINKTILSDAHVKSVNNQKIINSDAYVTSFPFKRKYILSDAKIVFGVLTDINNKFNSVIRVYKNVTSKFNSVIRVFKDTDNMFNMVIRKLNDINNDFRTKKLKLNNIFNDIRFLKSWQIPGLAGFQSLGKTYVKVYMNSIEQTDVDIDSITIYKSVSASHTATFDLGRAYDATKPDSESEVEIKYHIWTLYKGYIINISPAASPESITINCNDKYWQQNKTNKYFHVGHKPQDNKELYYETIKTAIATELGWNIDIGNFTPQTIDCFSTGNSDTLTSLIEQCGNFGWFYDVDGSKKLWESGAGNVINIERQEIGKNIGLYQLIDHKFTEDASDIVNKLRVQMGDKVIRKFNDTGGNRTYTGYNYRYYEAFLRPAWDSQYETLARDNSSGQGWDYHKQEDDYLYKEVFKKYNLPYLDSELSSWSDRYPPYIKVLSGGKLFNVKLETDRWGNTNILKEGFTIDYENKLVTFSEPIYRYGTDDNGEISFIKAPIFKLFIWKKNYYTFTNSPSDNPETDISNPLMFFTDKMGDYPDTIMQDLDLSSLNIQEGGDYYDTQGNLQHIPSWNDTQFAKELADWQLNKSCDKKISGNIELTLDALCFYNINLANRIYIEGITEYPMNINSISYNIGNFTVSLELQNHRQYKRSISYQSHGE